MAGRRAGTEEFALAFRGLLTAAGLSPDKVVSQLERVGMSMARSVLYDWRNGAHLPEDAEVMLAVVRVCRAAVKTRGAVLGPGVPGEDEAWERLLAQAKRARDLRAGRVRRAASAASDRAGKPIGQWDPIALGVHKAIGGTVPPYVRRAHDELLRAVLDPVPVGSRLVVLRGGSSTGKSRAAYEAVLDRLPTWRVDYPRTATALAARLDAGIAPRTVLWLDELRHYAEDQGGRAVLARLAEVLTGDGRVAAITTLWPDFWKAYTAEARTGPGSDDPARETRALLAALPELTTAPVGRIEPKRGGVIDVASHFSDDDLRRAVDEGGAVIVHAIQAARAAGTPGQLAQYLAGVPALLNHYYGPGADPYGRAVITAAMDAARFSYTSPFRRGLLLAAALGYLTPMHRAIASRSWEDAALRYATEELKGTVRALEPVPPEHGTGTVGYRLAEYLEQIGRLTRCEQMPPGAFWAAAAKHAHVRDLAALGAAASNRGLERDAAQLHKNAAAHGDADAAAWLVRRLHRLHPTDQRPARWCAAGAALNDPFSLAHLLDALSDAAAGEQVAALADRIAAQVPIGDPVPLAKLLERMREAGEGDQVTVLADRIAAHLPLDNPDDVAHMLGTLWEDVGAADQAAALADRAVAHMPLDKPADSQNEPAGIAYVLLVLRENGASDRVAVLLSRDPAAHILLDDPYSVAELLSELRKVGATDQVTALADRVASHVCLDDPTGIKTLLEMLREVGAGEQVTALAVRIAANPTLDDPLGKANLLHALWKVGAGEQATALAVRIAAHAPLEDPYGVAALVETLREVGAADQFAALLTRDPGTHVSLDHPYGVATLMETLREVGAADQFAALLARDPATHAAVAGDPYSVPSLLDALRKAGAEEQVAALADRIAAHAPLDDPYGVATLLRALRKVDAIGQVAALADRAASQVALDHPSVAILLDVLREMSKTNEVAALLARDPATQVSLDQSFWVIRLLDALRDAESTGQVTALADRIAAYAPLDSPMSARRLLAALRKAGAGEQAEVLIDRLPGCGMFALFCEQGRREMFWFGREPDGRPADTWGWETLA
jgi:uncharacterized protein YidB (DUF937 family)